MINRGSVSIRRMHVKNPTTVENVTDIRIQFCNNTANNRNFFHERKIYFSFVEMYTREAKNYLTR